MAAFDYLEQYSTFETVADMDIAVEQHIQQHYFNLTESERAIVFTLASRSLAFPGACHLKAETIANQVGISTKTVYRSIKKLVELGIIEKVTQSKLNGIKGASIYKILSFVENVPSEVSQRAKAETHCESKADGQIYENQPSISFNLKNNLKDNTYPQAESSAQTVDDKALLKTKEFTAYQQLRLFVDNFTKEKGLASKLYGIYLSHNKKSIVPIAFSNVIEAAKHTFNAVKRKYNSANPIDSVTGYFNNTLAEIARKESERACRELLNGNWMDSLPTQYEDYEMIF